jgi:hypothetical protein
MCAFHRLSCCCAFKLAFITVELGSDQHLVYTWTWLDLCQAARMYSCRLGSCIPNSQFMMIDGLVITDPSAAFLHWN